MTREVFPVPWLSQAGQLDFPCTDPGKDAAFYMDKPGNGTVDSQSMSHSLSEPLTLPTAVAETPHSYTRAGFQFCPSVGICCLTSVHAFPIAKASFPVFMGCLSFLFHAGDFAQIFYWIVCLSPIDLFRALPATSPS